MSFINRSSQILHHGEYEELNSEGLPFPQSAFGGTTENLPCHAKLALQTTSRSSMCQQALLAEAKESYDQRDLICPSEVDFVSRVGKAAPVVLNKIQTLAITLEQRAFLQARSLLPKRLYEKKEALHALEKTLMESL
ncbi:hypothetical protein GJ744_004155 [Endocarpon pusillum]|uniref:Uncharacterized protein n=1 Tax=Endocarpon pusillum TaxID=364733 RepID=A0A8H7ARC7_9EURO|nr:hypothetical protein GJ744_004155 [Endocarpon pusillum]